LSSLVFKKRNSYIHSTPGNFSALEQVTVEQQHKLYYFYSFLLKEGVTLYLAEGKRPKYKETDPRGLIKDDFDIIQSLRNGYDIRVDLKTHDSLLCIDFDFHKTGCDETYDVKSRLLKYLSELVTDTFVVSSPSGGLHAYLQDSTLSLKDPIGRFCKALIPNTDYLNENHGVTGPNGKNRIILQVPKSKMHPL
jgi:hypothetical protein